MDNEIIFKSQLKKICYLTGAHWLTWLIRTPDGWDIYFQFSLTKAQTIELKNYFLQPNINTWLAGALSGGHIRSKKTMAWKEKLGSQEIYAFPISNHQSILLVGANKLSEEERGFYRIITTIYQSYSSSEQLDQPISKSIPETQQHYSDYIRKGSQFFQTFTKIIGLSDLTEISRLSIQFISEKNNFEFISVALLDKKEDYLVTIISNGRLAGLINTKAPISATTGFSGKVMQDGKILFSNGTSQDDLYKFDQSLNQGSVVYIPLLQDKKVFGILTCRRSTIDEFPDDEIEILTNFTEALASVLSHVRKTQQNSIRIKNLEASRELSLDISVDLRWDEVVKRLIHHARELTGARGALLGLVDEKDGSIEIVVYDGPAEWRNYTGAHISPTVGLAGYAVTTKKPLIIENYNAWPDRFADLEADNLAAVPLLFKDQVIGVIVIGDDRPEKIFTHEDIKVLEMVAPQVALSVHNAKIYKTLETVVKKLQAYKETALDITSNLDSKILFYRLLQRVREFVDARGVYLGLVNNDRTAVDIVYEESPWKDPNIVHVEIPRGVNGWVVAHEQPIIVPDYNNWENRYQNMPYTAAAGVPLIYKDQVIGVIAVADDRPERKFNNEDIQLLELVAPQMAISVHNAQIYEALQESHAKLEASQQALIKTEKIATVGRLTASMAHEINNPLQSVQNCIHLARRHELSDKERNQYLELADQEMDRLKATVSRVLDMYRPASADRKLTDVNQLINRVILLIEEQSKEKRVKIHLDLSSNLPKAYVVSDQIHQVFLNMFLNSLQVMPDGGDLYIKTKIADHGIQITIEDTGPGIPADKRDKIFQPFESSKKDGTGLGLTISYGIMTAHGGQLNIVKGRGRGACFEIIIPTGD